MPVEFANFFTTGKRYRAPMYLATSTSKKVAENFIRINTGAGKLAILFTVKFDPVLRCDHVNYIGKVSAVTAESEYLMPPYSAFEVLSANISSVCVSQVTIKAFHDNLLPDLKNLPTAPWH